MMKEPKSHDTATLETVHAQNVRQSGFKPEEMKIEQSAYYFEQKVEPRIMISDDTFDPVSFLSQTKPENSDTI